MTLKKFTSIQGVGRFAQCVQKGPELKRLNLIFAENGRGKTTLCAVLRSLETGRHEHITERKTISSTPIQQHVTLRLDGGEARFAKNAWTTKVPEIAIFDGTFVAQNVHAGEYVTRDHRTNLLQVIVGDVGVRLAEDIDRLDGEIRDKNAELLRARKQIPRRPPKFLQLWPLENPPPLS